MNVQEMPLTEEVLDEAIARIKQYAMKRANEFYYVERYLKALQRYADFVESCILSGERPDTFDDFVQKKGGGL